MPSNLQADAILINEGKVDSRLERTKITHPTLPLERTFCAFCGKPKGWVTHNSGEFIDAANVVVVCDDCNSKFDSKLGKLPGQEVPIQEYNLRDAELGFDENMTNDWVENCIDCRIPMVKLQPIPSGKCAPIMESLRVGGTVLDNSRRASIERAKASATPTWFCRKCGCLWGAIDIFWCKFKRA